MNQPTHIIIHCSDLLYGSVLGIRRYHVEQLGWSDIGYHAVVENGRAHQGAPYVEAQDGALMLGRDIDGDGDVLEEEGAHALGYNARSLGLCLVGRRGTFTSRQMVRTAGYVAGWCKALGIPVAKVLGHNETEHELAKPLTHPDPTKRRKTCPDLEMVSFRRMVQEALHHLEAAQDAVAAISRHPESQAP